MSAITPHLEQYDEATEEEAAYRGCANARRGLAGRGKCPTPEEVVKNSHMKLLRMGLARSAAQEYLSGATMSIEYTEDGADIILDRPLGYGVTWNPTPPSDRDNTRIKLLTWTKKREAPSFSLPAGPAEIGGSCPGAVAGQSIVPASKLVKAARHVEKYTPRRNPEGAQWLADSVCAHCYAEKGNYAYGSQIMKAAIRFEWTKQAVDTRNPQTGNPVFVDVMIWAVDRADYKSRREPERHRSKGRYFRLHDSGDFYSPKYLSAWKQICNAFLPGNPNGFEPIYFWAPSRIWAIGAAGVAMVNKINNPPGNLAIRPSAYHVNAPAPKDLGPGWAASSTVAGAVGNIAESKRVIAAAKDAGLFDWNCRAYDADAAENHTCRNATAPDGGDGCRACWVNTDLTINYGLH